MKWGRAVSDEHVKVIRATYKERRDVMLEMMEEMFPAGMTWSKPQGGMFLWGVLPEGMDAAEVLKRAIEKKSRSCRVERPPAWRRRNMRINFSYSSPDNIREGITRLGNTLKELIAKEFEHEGGRIGPATHQGAYMGRPTAHYPPHTGHILPRAIPVWIAVSATARAPPLDALSCRADWHQFTAGRHAGKHVTAAISIHV
jgi:hypothetical protein